MAVVAKGFSLFGGTEMWLGLTPTIGSREVLPWVSFSSFVQPREKRKYSLSGEVEGMITSFRALLRQVFKAKGDLWLLSGLKQISSSNCYSTERVLSSPSLPLLSGLYGKNNPWLFLRVGYALLALTEFKKQALSLLCTVLINKTPAVPRSR